MDDVGGGSGKAYVEGRGYVADSRLLIFAEVADCVGETSDLYDNPEGDPRSGAPDSVPAGGKWTRVLTIGGKRFAHNDGPLLDGDTVPHELWASAPGEWGAPRFRARKPIYMRKSTKGDGKEVYEALPATLDLPWKDLA